MNVFTKLSEIAVELPEELVKNSITANNKHRLELEFAKIVLNYETVKSRLKIQFHVARKSEGRILYPPRMQMLVYSRKSRDRTIFELSYSLVPWNGPADDFDFLDKFEIEPTALEVVTKMHECYAYNLEIKRISA